MLVVRDLVFLGKRRFKEFEESGEGIATNVLADRLQSLTEADILQSAKDPEDGRRVLYSLTKKGLDLIPILVDLAAFGGKHDADTAAPKAMLKRLEQDRDGVIQELRQRLSGA